MYARKIDKTQIANELGVSRATLYKLIKEYDAS
ncbi:helix-turn-helix domain-containing protein [Bacillus sp. GB_SG_008]